MTQQLKIAHLNEKAQAKVRALEQAINKHVMAYERGIRFADLSDEELAQVHALEKELGVILLAYNE